MGSMKKAMRRLLKLALLIGLLLTGSLLGYISATAHRIQSGAAVGIHLGVPAEFGVWQSSWLEKIREPGGCWPAVIVVISGNVYTKHRLIGLNPVASQEAYSHTKGILPGLADQIERTCHFC